MTTTLAKPAAPNQFGKWRVNASRSRQSAQVVTLKSGQQNASSLTQNRLTQNRQCRHLSFVQAQHYRVALESRAIRKLNHKSETVRIRLRGLEAFMRWVVGLRVAQGRLTSEPSAEIPPCAILSPRPKFFSY